MTSRGDDELELPRGAATVFSVSSTGIDFTTHLYRVSIVVRSGEINRMQECRCEVGLDWLIGVRHVFRMHSPQNSPKPPQEFVFWIIWFAILQGLVILQFFVGGGIPKGTDQGQAPLWVLVAAGGLALVALAIRFTVIPRIASVAKKLPAMIVGLAFSEGIGFLGMFALGKEFPATQLVLLVMAICCIVSFAPVYAKVKADDGRF